MLKKKDNMNKIIIIYKIPFVYINVVLQYVMLYTITYNLSPWNILIKSLLFNNFFQLKNKININLIL